MILEKLLGLFPGCTIAAQRIGFKHLGIYAGSGQVIHSTSRTGKVVLESVARFANDGAISRYPIPCSNPDLTLQRAIQMLGRPYNLLWDNCEHFVRSMNGLPKQSYQLQKAYTVAGGLSLTRKSAPRKYRFAGAGVAVAAALTPEQVSPILTAVLGAGAGLLLERATR